MTTEPAAPVDVDDITHRVDRAWRALAEGPAALPVHIAQLSRLAGEPLAARLAALLEARLRLFNEDRSGCESSLAAAEQPLPPGTQDSPQAAELAIACAEMRALLLARDGAWSEARALLQPLLQELPDMRTPTLRFLLLTRQALVLERLGEFDEALAVHYARLAEARAIGSPWLLGLTLATLGGLQSSLLNLDDALALCEEAWALCRDDPARTGVAGTAGPNFMMALSGLGRHDEAAALARRLLADDAQYPAHQRAQRLCLYAAALQRAGQASASQDCLDQCTALDGEGVQRRSEWVWTQTALWNQQGRGHEALQLVLRHLASGVGQAHGCDYPIDAFELHRQAAIASEALGDLRGALHHTRCAGAARERALERAGRARSVTLQARHDLAVARQQRDQAQQAQAGLADVNARLHQANQAKVRFLAAASHDLRQPLHALTLRAAALRLELQTPRQRELLASIEHCAATMGSMFDALLDLSRAEAGVLQKQCSTFDLGALLLRLIEEHRPIAEDQGLGLALRLGRRVPAFADTDPRLLETLLRNLLGNAIKYSPRGGVLLCARLGRGPEGLHWRLQVRDSGVGIAADRQAAVFEEFYQLDNPARRQGRGQGLGLAIVQRLAGLLGHPLSLRSAPGRGSCFEVRVPVAPPVEPPATDAALAGRDPANEPAGHREHDRFGEPDAARQPADLALHVAVIEDDLEVQRALRSWLEARGCRVSVGLDADEVLAAARAAGPMDAVLADLRLPGPRDGAAEVMRLRDRVGRTVPALILTGDVADEALGDRLTEAVPRRDTQGLPWLRKPVEVARLAAWLEGIGPA